MLKDIIEAQFPAEIADRRVQAEEVQRQREAEARRRQEEMLASMPVIHSKAHVFKGMKAMINVD